MAKGLLSAGTFTPDLSQEASSVSLWDGKAFVNYGHGFGVEEHSDCICFVYQLGSLWDGKACIDGHGVEEKIVLRIERRDK